MNWGTNRELWFIILVIALFVLFFPGIFDDDTTSCRS